MHTDAEWEKAKDRISLFSLNNPVYGVVLHFDVRDPVHQRTVYYMADAYVAMLVDRPEWRVATRDQQRALDCYLPIGMMKLLKEQLIANLTAALRG